MYQYDCQMNFSFYSLVKSPSICPKSSAILNTSLMKPLYLLQPCSSLSLLQSHRLTGKSGASTTQIWTPLPALRLLSCQAVSFPFFPLKSVFSPLGFWVLVLQGIPYDEDPSLGTLVRGKTCISLVEARGMQLWERNCFQQLQGRLHDRPQS